jgi:hypothetical protein
MTDANKSATETADAFRGFEQAFKDAKSQQEEDAKQATAVFREKQTATMSEYRISDAEWGDILAAAQKAAQHGAQQYLLLRFPSGLCTDDSRAINNPPDDSWPETLRGEAAEIYQRWHDTLRPQGFGLSASVLDFPGGKPGDIGLFLRWGDIVTKEK